MSLSRTLAHLLVRLPRSGSHSEGTRQTQLGSCSIRDHSVVSTQLSARVDVHVGVRVAEHKRLQEVVGCTSGLPAHLQRHSGRTGGCRKETHPTGSREERAVTPTPTKATTGKEKQPSESPYHGNTTTKYFTNEFPLH